MDDSELIVMSHGIWHVCGSGRLPFSVSSHFRWGFIFQGNKLVSPSFHGNPWSLMFWLLEQRNVAGLPDLGFWPNIWTMS